MEPVAKMVKKEKRAMLVPTASMVEKKVDLETKVRCVLLFFFFFFFLDVDITHIAFVQSQLTKQVRSENKDYKAFKVSKVSKVTRESKVK